MDNHHEVHHNGPECVHAPGMLWHRRMAGGATQRKHVGDTSKDLATGKHLFVCEQHRQSPSHMPCWDPIEA